MYVVSAVANEPEMVSAPAGLPYGTPCVFKGCSGFFHPGVDSTGVVLCSPWGFEELTMRKSWRLLAESIADAGFPCIRFDYPGTGNSAGVAADVASVDDWVGSINAAAEFLRLTSGVRRFVFLGQSLGATLAFEAARTRTDVVGLQLIAPVIRGRAYVRELAATTTMVAEKIGIKDELAINDGASVLGFSLSKPMVESLKGLDLTKAQRIGVSQAVVYDKVDRKACAEAVVHLRKLDVAVTIEPVEPFHLMVSDATVIQPLPVAPARIIASLRALHETSRNPSVGVAPAFPSALVGSEFREEPIRFGVDNALFGILCRPLRPRPDGPAIVLLNRGLNAHIGWRRSAVDQARGLAAAGFTSLRVDVAGIGESRDIAGRPPNLIYSDLLLPDIRAAVDALAARGHTRIALAGVCSGGYMALNAANVDPRVTDVIAVNAQRFVWNPAEKADDLIRFGLRSMNDYVGDIKSGNMLKKLIRSRRRLLPATLFMLRRNMKNVWTRLPIGFRAALSRNSMPGRVNRMFATFAERGTRVSLIFSAGDPGLVELRSYYGVEGRSLRFPNVSISTIADADHNLTTTCASAALLDQMIAHASEHTLREESRAAMFQGRPTQRAVCPT